MYTGLSLFILNKTLVYGSCIDFSLSLVLLPSRRVQFYQTSFIMVVHNGVCAKK